MKLKFFLFLAWSSWLELCLQTTKANNDFQSKKLAPCLLTVPMIMMMMIPVLHIQQIPIASWLATLVHNNSDDMNGLATLSLTTSISFSSASQPNTCKKDCLSFISKTDYQRPRPIPCFSLYSAQDCSLSSISSSLCTSSTKRLASLRYLILQIKEKMTNCHGKRRIDGIRI